MKKKNKLKFSVKKFICKQLESYQNNKEINDQFNIDIERSHNYFNNIKLNLKNYKIIDIYIKKYITDKKIYINEEQEYNIKEIIYLLYCQSSYASSYFFINNIYSNIEKNIHCICESKNRYIKIILYKKRIFMIIKSEYKILNIKKNKVKNRIKTKLFFEYPIDTDEDIMGVFKWQEIDN